MLLLQQFKLSLIHNPSRSQTILQNIIYQYEGVADELVNLVIFHLFSFVLNNN